MPRMVGETSAKKPHQKQHNYLRSGGDAPAPPSTCLRASTIVSHIDSFHAVLHTKNPIGVLLVDDGGPNAEVESWRLANRNKPLTGVIIANSPTQLNSDADNKVLIFLLKGPKLSIARITQTRNNIGLVI